MFGFSFTKLLFTAAIVLIVWYGFKMVTRLDRQRREELKKAARETVQKSTRRAEPQTEDMVKCAVCDTYVPSGSARSCGRPNCPYPG